MKIKKYCDYNSIFRNYNLTELITCKRGKRKSVGDKYSVFILVTEMLKEYGLNSFGNTKIGEDLELRHFRIDKKFPVENINIIDQMYGYDNIVVDVGLPFENDMQDYSFGYCTNTKSCLLRKNVWGTVEKNCLFNSFAELMEARNKVKSFEDLL